MSKKLAQAGNFVVAGKLRQCHAVQTVAQCDGCRKVVMFWNRCDLFYCPQCSPRLSKMRLDGLMWWVETLKQPKHLVLTFANVESLTAEYIAKCKKSLAKFRRTKLFSGVRSGLWAMEITNKKRGWHLHFHLVIDAPWMDVREISRVWKKVNGGVGEIVWIESADKGGLRANLPRYVTKYCGKGFRPHDWTPEMLEEFVTAVEQGRTFGVFGELLGKRTEWRDFIKTLRKSRRECECGCASKSYYSQLEWQWKENFTGFDRGRPPPPISKTVLQFGWKFASE